MKKDPSSREASRNVVMLAGLISSKHDDGKGGLELFYVQEKMLSGKNALTTQLGASTTSLSLKSTVTLQSM